MRRGGTGRESETVLWSRSPQETEELGAELAREVAVPGVILLRGALGTGKTTLVRGIARAFDIGDPAEVSSPSFTLVNIYQGRAPIYHVDLYRLEGARAIASLGLDEFLGVSGLTVVEWSERLPLEAEGALEVEIEDAGDDLRRLRVRRPRVSRNAGSRKEKSAAATSKIHKPARRRNS